MRKSPVEQVEVRRDRLPAVKPAPDLHPAAVVDHVDELERRVRASEKVVGRRVQLPELADRLALPAANVCRRPRPVVGQLKIVRNGPVPDL